MKNIIKQSVRTVHTNQGMITLVDDVGTTEDISITHSVSSHPFVESTKPLLQKIRLKRI
ncbi:MAG: hypothetical protein KJ963_00010 [Bacteroidetes bacterium]|nr:hypothetical protein [Bacteroidota bacterium]